MRGIIAACWLLLPAGLLAQTTGIGELIRFDRPLTGVTAPAISPVIQDASMAGSHLILVQFPTAVATTTPVQVRIEAAYTCPDPPTCATGNWVPISSDVTSVPLNGVGGLVIALARANGTFPAIRVRSLLATPGALPMDVFYTGSPFPIGNIVFTGDRWLIVSGSGGYDKATFVVCNGSPCALGTNLTNEYIVVQGLTPRICYACAKTAPTGAALIIDINRNGASIFGAPKLTVPAGSACSTGISSATNFASSAGFATLDRLTVDIDQIGSVVAGQDVTVTCVLDF